MNLQSKISDLLWCGFIMTKDIKVNLADIKIQDVGTDCVLLVTKFSRLLKLKHGVILKVQDKQVLSKVAAYANSSNSAQLKIIYDRIQGEITQHLQKINQNKFSFIEFKVAAPSKYKNLSTDNKSLGSYKDRDK